MLGRIVTVAVVVVAAASTRPPPTPSRKAPPPPRSRRPIFTWTGFLHRAPMRARRSANNQCGIQLLRPGYWPNNNGGNNVGFTGGGQIGYWWQMGPAVLGLEADLNHQRAERQQRRLPPSA